MSNRFTLLAAALVLAACSEAVAPVRTPDGPARAPRFAIEPVFVGGNISGDAEQVCNTSPVNPAGGWFGFKVEGAVPGGEGGIAATISPDGKYLSWTAGPEYLVQAVLIKGGTGQHIYSYGGTSSGDAGLVSPLNNAGNVPTISHWILCYTVRPAVMKTAATSFDREFDWSIAKTASHSALTLAPSEVFTVGYTVQVGAVSTDRNFAVAGTISVHNPAPMAIELTSLTDQLSSGEQPPVVCPVALPYTMAVDETLVCSYQSGLPDAGGRTNTATAVSSTPGVESGSGQAAVDFGEPTQLIDACVSLSDTYAGAGLPPTLCHTGLTGGSTTFTYSREIGPFASGTHTIGNTASLVTADQGTTASSSAEVVVTVPTTGCTLTQGYWKTHADGSRHYDPTWAAVGGSGTTFFLSGRSWLEVFRTPVQGNPYYQLAHQYMAAVLNQHAGAASTPSVTAAMSGATAFFGVKTPAQKLTTAERAMVLGWASLLASYNEGAVGPGHCAE